MKNDLKKRKEQLDKRPEEFERSRPDVVIERALETLRNSFIDRELAEARDLQLHYVIMMGVHSCIYTINEYIFGKKGEEAFEAFKEYLEKYVDGEGDDYRFSRYSDKIYLRRNAMAHRFFSKTSHDFGFDAGITEGIVEKSDGIVLINTVSYFDHFKSAFERDRKTKKSIWDITREMTTAEQEASKERIIKSYLNS